MGYKIFSLEVLEKQEQRNSEIQKFIFSDSEQEYERLLYEITNWENKVFDIIERSNKEIAFIGLTKWVKKNDNEIVKMLSDSETLTKDERNKLEQEIIKKITIYEDEDVSITTIMDYDFGIDLVKLVLTHKQTGNQYRFTKVFHL